MTRVKRSVHARKKRRATLKLAKGYRGDASRHYGTGEEAVLKADQYRYRDRRNRTPTSAAYGRRGSMLRSATTGCPTRSSSTGCSTPRRVRSKILADMAVRDPDTFRRFADRAREALAAG